MDANWGTSALMHIARLTNSPAKSLKTNGDKIEVFFFEEYTTIGLRVSGYGAAEVFIDFAEEVKHIEAHPMCSIH